MANIDIKRANKMINRRPVFSVILMIFISILIFASIAMVYFIFGEYSIQLKLANEVDSISELYSGNNDLFSLISRSSKDYFITDPSGNIISGNTDNTADLSKHPLDMDYFFIKGRPEYQIYSDKNSDFLITSDNDNDVIINVFDLMDFDKVAIQYRSGKATEIPYWICYPAEDGTTVYIKSNLAFRSGDLIFILALSITLSITMILIMLAILIFGINNIRYRKDLQKLLFMDRISGGHNWSWFLINASKLISRRKNLNNGYAVINLVFVKYRYFVLCHSSSEGEKMLREVYLTILKNIGPRDLASHSTEAHFPILMRYDSEEGLRQKVQNIISQLESIDTDHKFGFQAGIDLIPPQTARVRRSLDLDIIYNNASAARMQLDMSEESGIAFYDNDLLEQHKWIDLVTEKQRDAIDKEEFIVYYQPKYNPNTNQLQGAEALIRWQNEELGFVSPGRFIPIFESSGFITEIDHYMLSHVARDQAKWLSQGFKIVPVSVNVSRAHFIEDDLAEQIRDICLEANCPAEYIEIEVTESAFFDDKNKMIETIRKLQSYGFSVSMDDFGSGYSSLNSLKDLPLNILKLDAGFFAEGDDDDRSKVVVSEALKLAKSLNMKTVAEGIEDKVQVDFLAREGCDMIQGYYFAKPMPASDYESRMAQETIPGSEA